MKASKTLIITGVFALLAVAAICYYALMQFAEEKYSIVLKDSSLEIVDFAIEDKEETTNDVPPNPLKNPYFGDLHVHTRYSFDAYVFGVNATPYDAYRYAKGEMIKHPLGYEMQLKEPLDFYAVTDHGIYMGMIQEYGDPNSPQAGYEWAVPFQNINREENRTLESMGERLNLFSLMAGDGYLERPYPVWHPKMWQAIFTKNRQLASKAFDYGVHKSAWADIANAAEENNEPGKFTTFIGYEFTAGTEVEGGNLHRNVIFESSKAPIRPWSREDSLNPMDLWAWMDKLRAKGLDSIAIPHNSNGSNGEMFEVETYYGTPIDLTYSETRMRNEPIVEITQVKGTSDTHPLLSPDDDWADFEIMDGRVGARPPTYSYPAGGYVRDAYLRGLMLDWKGQGNPYKFGLIGSTDTHLGAGSFDESNFWSKVGVVDGSPMSRGSIPLTELRLEQLREYSEQYNQPVSAVEVDGNSYAIGFDQWGSSGLAAVWAEENTRESIFSALRRKEAFATTGPRVAVRFFAGFDLTSIDVNAESLVEEAYKKGVPMGADLFADGEKVPEFLVWAQKDKHSASLQRIQIIKGSITNSGARPSEKVFDVVCSDGLKVDPTTHRCPDNGARVNIEDCSITNNVGATELKATWRDPDFNPKDKAFYYVRVLENPTCRWSTWDALKAGIKPRSDLHETIQERAWSSPIWYIPVPEDIDIFAL